LKSLIKEVDELFDRFIEEEEHSGVITIGEFVYRLAMAGIHEVLSNVADYMKPMGKVVIEDRELLEDPLFNMDVESGAETTEGENDESDS